MLRTGPASGALDKRELPNLVYDSDIFLADLHSFHQRADDLSLVVPVQRFDSVGELLGEFVDVVDDRFDFLLLVSSL
jgi:hypothetical protein